MGKREPSEKGKEIELCEGWKGMPIKMVRDPLQLPMGREAVLVFSSLARLARLLGLVNSEVISKISPYQVTYAPTIKNAVRVTCPTYT